MCGEKFGFFRSTMIRLGSPPRMRGKGVVHVFVPEKFGITPAYAGKRRDFSYTQLHGKDHPRTCGEKAASRAIPSSGQGHPRTCGEKFGKWSTKGRITGSPPRMRGKDVTSVIRNCTARITPAHAGKRQHQGLYPQAGRVTPAHAGKRRSAPPRCRPPEDHPRMCGEKQLRQAIAVQHIGSPPHVRGKVRLSGCLLHCSGDHPRMCGEKEVESVFIVAVVGSPPHVRGKGAASRAQRRASGDHPRMCGEKLQKTAFLARELGSPPHVRGKA